MEDRNNPYRYMIVFCSSTILFFCPSTAYANGVFLVNFKRTGLYDVDTLAWVMSLTQFMHAMGGPIAGYLISLTSCRTAIILGGVIGLLGFSLGSVVTDVRLLFLTYGGILGVARGIVFSSTNVNLGYWFKENSSVASGLTFAGVGIGMLVHPRLVQALVDWFDVQDAQLLMGALLFHTSVMGMLLRSSEFEKARKVTLRQEKLVRKGESVKTKIVTVLKHFSSSVLKNVTFIWFVIGICCFSMAFQAILVFLPDFYNYHGSTPQEAALAVSLMGTGSLISRILVGIITNDPNIGTILLFSGNCGLTAIMSFFLFALVETPAGRYIYSVCVGTYLACCFVLIGPTTLQKVGLENLPYGFGFILFSMGFADLFGPPLAMQVRHLTGSYYAVFVMAGCLLLGASFCGFLSEMFKRTTGVEFSETTEGKILAGNYVFEEVIECQETESSAAKTKISKIDETILSPILEEDDAQSEQQVTAVVERLVKENHN